MPYVLGFPCRIVTFATAAVKLAERFGPPVLAIGVGETAEGLRPFKARDFANSADYFACLGPT